MNFIVIFNSHSTIANAIQVTVKSFVLRGKGQIADIILSSQTPLPNRDRGKVDQDGNQVQGTLIKYSLSQNYPNPFNPITTIEFDLSKTSDVMLKIFNILGEEVAVLVSDRLSAGNYTYEWDASNMANGVYLYRLKAGEFVETKKMILMR